MSRPFSYNDENFTVIGNILFCHIKLTSDTEAYQNIIEIPSAIYERLMYYNNQMIVVGGKKNALAANVVIIIVSNYGKYYLCPTTGFGVPPYEYLIGFYFLKDI